MLEKLSAFGEQVRTCRQRAEDAKRKAERTSDWASKIHFLKMETRWLALARSYELTGVIAANLDRRGQSEELVRAGERHEPRRHHHKLEQGRGAALWLFGRGGHRPRRGHPDSSEAST